MTSYFLVWTPQSEKIQQLSEAEQELGLKIQENNMMLAQEKKSMNHIGKQDKNKESIKVF